MIKAAIVENKKTEADALTQLLKKAEGEIGARIDVVCFQSGDAFLFGYNGSFDVCFISVELSGLDGIAVAKKLRDKDKTVRIVFTSASAKNAIMGYEVNAIDYMVLPLHYAAVKSRMEQVCREVRNEDKALAVTEGTGGGDLYFTLARCGVYRVEQPRFNLSYDRRKLFVSRQKHAQGGRRTYSVRVCAV